MPNDRGQMKKCPTGNMATEEKKISEAKTETIRLLGSLRCSFRHVVLFDTSCTKEPNHIC